MGSIGSSVRNVNDIISFNIATHDTGSTMAIKIQEPNLRAQNLSLTTWTSSVILANRLHKYRPKLLAFPTAQGKPESGGDGPGELSLPVLELGAGTALAGISAAVIWQTTVILTDLSPIVPGIEMNIELNRSILDKSNGSAAAGALDWSKPDALHLYSSQDSPTEVTVPSTKKACVILAADVIYDSEQPLLLSDAILHWLERSADARVFLTLPLRVAYLDEIRELWQRLRDGGLETIEEGQEEMKQSEETGWEWNDEALCEWSIWRWRMN